ncbi:hypothetical protein FB567DRAFT_42935 [Paraphoma chrysanthemicola]|uniref:Methyltransferase type 11 domain-containing protein n=1 Tax=Paraphoma chrysanthemicola TaxID=798071 RepID=A0A8K0RIB4_9PLEO|nr:hypothetical protein FB567DRAFT_42935 [Paraphoma chrysanthemicola]
MFSADLSWTDPGTEKVGERRERKARERSSTTNSIKTSTSSRSSISGERELWWTSGLKKAKDLKPSILRPTSQRTTNSQTTTRSNSKKSAPKLTHSLKDPALQPPWTYATTLSHTLPSGGQFDLPLNEVPELEGDTSSGRTASTDARFSLDRRWEVKTPVKTELHEEPHLQQRRGSDFSLAGGGRASAVSTDREDLPPIATQHFPVKEKRRPRPVIVESTLNFEALRLHDTSSGAGHSKQTEYRAQEVVEPDARMGYLPLSQWECLTPRGVPQGVQLTPKSSVKKVAAAHSSTLELTRFQRFIRRMESAGPKTILDRLQEEWHDNTGEEVDDELALEKQLWLLTGFQMQNFGKVRQAPKPMCKTGKILELYGNLSEVFQVSAMHPHQTVHFLTTKPQRPITLPANVSYLTIREYGAVPLPYPENYFSHIRASTLPSLVPSSKLPELFRECYKLLAPGGLLEIRIIDAAPVRKTTGPLLRAWIEDRLTINLERLFRCSKPCLLMPSWLTDAGFDLTQPEGDPNVILPCANGDSSDIDRELSTTIGRALWKDIWGTFVDDVPGESKWWWEDPEIVEECIQRQTTLECRAIFAHKM